MKNILKYIIIFCITFLSLCLLLFVTAKIPKSAILENLKESTNVFKTRFEIDERVKRRDYTFTHPYADAMLLNIIMCTDTDKPVQSVLEAKYYSKHENGYISYDFNDMIENNVNGNVEYLRYWHGQISILRPLLIFFNLSEIYIINNIVFWSLTIALIIILIKKKHINLLVSLLIGLIMCAAPIIPLCLEYSATFIITLIVSIIIVLIESKTKSLGIIFFVTGIITNYFDFLTTEIITAFVPIIFLLGIRHKEQRLNSLKEAILLSLKLSILWLTGYSLMWVSKWIIASIILNINAMDLVKDHILERLSGELLYISPNELPFKAISRNLFVLYPLNIQKNIKKLIIIPIAILIFELIFIKKKNIKKELWFSLIMLLIGLVPYLRYAILANHSYRHYFFTFRSQIITIMCLILAIIYSIDKEILKKEIKIKRIKS